MDEDAWERICLRCGQCCFEKWIGEDGRVCHTRIPCRHLDVVSRQCRVYHKRLEVGEGCIKLTADVVRQVSWLPHDCAYRRALDRCE